VTPEPPQYLMARLRRALAEDQRTAEQGIRMVVHGATAHLFGEVTTAQRCTALTEVVAEHAPGHDIRNDVRVVPVGQPRAREELP
jgi:osmotically-inducible protein OsmY